MSGQPCYSVRPPHFVYICLSVIPFSIYFATVDNCVCLQQVATREMEYWDCLVYIFDPQSSMILLVLTSETRPFCK